jgi:hypothetical protein
LASSKSSDLVVPLATTIPELFGASTSLSTLISNTDLTISSATSVSSPAALKVFLVTTVSTPTELKYLLTPSLI